VERPLHIRNANLGRWSALVLDVHRLLPHGVVLMQFETILSTLRNSPGRFAWREDPAWKGEAIKFFDGDLVQFDLSDPEWHCLVSLSSEDLLADDWEVAND
jgi:hypothetical protein